jgi:hypothetical protein
MGKELKKKMKVCAWRDCTRHGTDRLDPNALTIDESLFFCGGHVEKAREKRQQFKVLEQGDLFHGLRRGDICWSFIQSLPVEKRTLYIPTIRNMLMAYQMRCEFQKNIKKKYKGEGHDFYIHTLKTTLDELWPLLVDEEIRIWQPVWQMNRKQYRWYTRTHPWRPRRL